MANRITLEGLADMTAADMAAIPAEELAMLAEDLADLNAAAKDAGDNLGAALAARYAGKAAAKRAAAGKDAGTVTLKDDGFKVTADLPKRVAWDQAALALAVETLAGWGEDPAEYITREVKVSETKYNAWPPAIKALFTPARTVSVGAPAFKITAKG